MMKEPEKIIKKQHINGQLKYQVKWKGFDETTWEVEDNVKKYKELIEDFNYFCLTGERYDDKKLDEIRQITAQAQPRTAIKRVAGPRPPDPNKKDKKTEKVDQKQSEISETLSQSQLENGNNNHTLSASNNNNILICNENQTPQNSNQNNVISNLQTSLIVNMHQQNHKTGSIISQKQQELTQKVTQHYANQDDKLAVIKLQITEDNCVFQLQWKQRSDGITPLPEFYSYEQFKLQAPLFFIKFIETCLLECQSSDSDIKFEIAGKDMFEKTNLIKSALQKREMGDKKKGVQQLLIS
ncbi:unnamed protein product (macronuclear) [Paramecium tetraurelia]|uniref:Chromo domain-containing protein n=1 Tax=Paramecium tetraurelia TaxID=5888 RepID=A0BPM5_PARTE|nr:uncharacterized protein GSPATT00005241001 [Paramecium tetraurelia]CAK60492.1 unnamed protein product [Paramecium tetraurelia]|eukprot:XP_001427890.1 hypothetical protein (macronuclear) [Paramecium tetraurelia strain d4-2]